MNQKNLFKKFILGIFIFLFIIPLFVRPAKAFETKGSFFEFEEAIGSEEMNLQSFVNETLKAIMGSFIHFIIGPLGTGCSPETPDNCLTQGEGQFLGLIPTTSLIIANLYSSPPASGLQYFANLGRKISIVSPAFAEEKFNTFRVMEFIQPLWTAFRNLSYVLFVLILVGMGFAIMFRVKISPQAVITIQSALPRIVIALILITFSYAIVGLILDVGMFLNSTLGAIFKGIFVSRFDNNWVMVLAEKASAALSPAQVHPLVRPFADAFVYGGTAGGAIFVAAFASITIMPLSILVWLIIAILLAIAFLKTIWVLLRTFAMIIINIIFAPLRILFGVLPGNNATIDWFKDIIANVAILPGMLCLYFIGNYLIIEGIQGQVTMPIRASTEGFGLYGGFWIVSALILPLIGIFILLLIPKVADIIQSFITKKPFQYGTAIGEAMGPTMIAGKMGATYGVEETYQRLFAGGKAPLKRYEKQAGAIKDLIQKRLSK